MHDGLEHHRHDFISDREKEELLGLVQMRFGRIPEEIRNKVMAMDNMDMLNRLFLVAVNSANWEVFVTELNQGEDAFKMAGDGFDPLSEKRYD